MSSQTPGYTYIWEYTVWPEHAADFEQAYGPNGAWVALFKRARGYLRTELHRDRNVPNRYVTIDYWGSLAAWQAFRAAFSAEFEAIDAQCGSFTQEEREVGRFTPLA
ncbi:MAG: hypothetical protein CL608_29095 [Anaerolineaceae bacterium]|nr:hypothetical protein [Anaerolineaceae bacterium]